MQQLAGGGVCLRVMSADDLEQVLVWRNTPGVSKFMLNQDQISPVQHQQWFERVSGRDDQAHFVILYRNERVGVINLKAVNCDALRLAEKIEVGMYLGDERYRGTFMAFIPAILTNDYSFNELKAKCLVAKVLPGNSAALRFNQELGYRTVSSGNIVEMTLDHDSYLQASAKIRRFIR